MDTGMRQVKLSDQEKYICKSEMLENEQQDLYSPPSKVNMSAPEDHNNKFDPVDLITFFNRRKINI